MKPSSGTPAGGPRWKRTCVGRCRLLEVFTGRRLTNLELGVPPDVVWVLVAGLMWLVSRVTTAIVVAGPPRAVTALALMLAGTALVVASRRALDRAGTTWHPTDPRRSTSLLTTGVYRFSRNPTYVGMELVLLSWAAVLASPLAALLSASFVAYIDRFQARPEERILVALFGDGYRGYARTVRRWV